MELCREQVEGEKYFCNDDAIFALATVPGKSAVAVFRCSGRQVWRLLAPAFSRYSALLRAPSHTVIYGFLQRPNTAEILDEVLLLKFCAPRSYSGEDMLEIHCHGGLAVLAALRALLLQLGMREAERGEFTYRSIKYGKRTLHQAEAIALLAASTSQNQRRSALELLDSPLLQKLQQLRGALLQVLARTELQLDYDETELEFSYNLPDSLPLALSSLRYLQDCLVSYQLHKNCWRECKIVLLGAVNSGKSSLFNRLLARARSLVSAQAGTTRDYIEARLELAGQSVLLYDTAGLRYGSEDPIEKQGIQRSWQLLQQADILLLLSDVRLAQKSPDTEESQKEREKCRAKKYSDDLQIRELQQQRRTLQAAARPVIEIWNKCDLLDEPPRPPAAHPNPVFCCSAVSGQGLESLLSELKNRLPAVQFGENEAPVSERQAALLRQAVALLEEYCRGLQESGQSFALDWGSELLRQICGRLGEISGESCNAVMLRDIFQQFCVGK